MNAMFEKLNFVTFEAITFRVEYLKKYAIQKLKFISLY